MRYLIIIFLSLFSQLLFAEYRFTVTDGAGKPLADTLVWFRNAAQPAPHEGAVIVDQTDRAFAPRVALARVGQRVDFPNSDNIRHHIYSFSQPNAFEIRLYGGDEAKNHVFSHAGLVVLGCNIHDNMRAYLHVVDRGVAVLSNAAGEVILDSKPEGAVDVWHERLSATHTDFIQWPTAPEAGASMALTLLPEKPAKSNNSFRSRYRF